MKKIIAPLIITLFFLAYFIVYFAVLLYLIPDLFIKILLGVVPLSFGALIVYVFIQRINEIRSGEEDDLSKY